MFGNLHIAIFKLDLGIMPYMWVYRTEIRHSWRLYDESGDRIDLDFLQGAELVATAPVSRLDDVQQMLALANNDAHDGPENPEGIPF